MTTTSMDEWVNDEWMNTAKKKQRNAILRCCCENNMTCMPFISVSEPSLHGPPDGPHAPSQLPAQRNQTIKNIEYVVQVSWGREGERM